MLKEIALGIAMAVALAEPAAAGAWEDGIAAYKRGDYAEAVRFMSVAAEDGVAAAQINLGVAYASGTGVGRNYGESIKWFRRAAEQGAAPAQFNLGVIYQRGLGVPQDHAEAARWYLLAADADDPRAQPEIGIKLAQGDGIGEDKVMALKWLILAAINGEEHAAMHRDIVSGDLSEAERQQADALAHAWTPRQ